MTAPHFLARAPLIVLAVVCLGAADPEVDRGLSLFKALEYDRAVVILGRALSRTDLSRADRIEALQALAFSYTILQDEVHARETFHRLLDLEPSYEVPSSQSPRYREAFAKARTTWIEGRKVRFTLEDDPTQIIGILSGDPARVGEVVAKTDRGEASAIRCTKERCSGERPDVPFTIEVRDHNGTVLEASGPYDPVGEREGVLPWWAWAAIGAGIVGGGVMVLVAASPGDPPAGSLGSLQLPLRSDDR